MPLHAYIFMHMCPCRDTNMFEIPSSLLHMELPRTQVHKYDFSNRLGYVLHLDVVQI